jgi:hypothetical protein
VPENPSILHVVGRTADGQLWHTTRSPGGWTQFSNVILDSGLLSQFGHVVDAACSRRLAAAVSITEGLYVFVAFDNAPPKLLFRNSNTSAWSEEGLSTFPIVRGVGAGTLDGFSTVGSPHAELHLAAVTHNGHLIASEHNYGAATSTSPQDVEAFAGDRGDFTAVAVPASSSIDGATLSLYAVTAEGRLFTTTGSSASGWQPFDEVVGSTTTGKLPADVIDADAVLGPLGISIVAVTGDGHVWIAEKPLNGAWKQWRDLETYTASFSGGGISGTFTATADVGTFSRVTAASTTQGLHVVGVTTNGRLWHQLRSVSMPVFADIEQVGVGKDVGFFTAVACA